MGGYRQVLFIGASVLTLIVSGCMEGSDKAGDAAGEATAFSERPSSSRLVERDVEAPEVFQTTDQGLWDGRPSLGGVWVAYPDVTDPERVIIRNDANGKFVIGALFKRERDNPGPKLQVSSDAAAALDMLAGAPTTLNVTALRREEPAPTAEVKEDKTAEVEAAPKEDAATEATIAGASAAIAAAEGDGASADLAETATQAAEAEPKKRGWNPFRRKSAETTATEDAVASVADTVETGTAVAGVTEAANEAVTETAAEVVAAPVKTKRGWNPFKRKNSETVMPASATGTAALATGEITASSLDGTPRAIADEAAAAPETRQTISKLDKPYVQIGIFSVEDNANNTATAMRQNGVVPQVYKQESSGKTFWRVVAGPVNSKVDRTALLKKVKGMGFADAYPVGG
ncbi:SPOR domain-containing protein [Aliiruegeria lutimaris]|uniref:Sporulation related domain-containing protein n=1 Tax=Aliiruegeria lutimaris TaxID=571298 RepID=A0A1G9L000_9RHOB|nr:Sporulation related domain-containing protein [Aliiruegeria lutimaris]